MTSYKITEVTDNANQGHMIFWANSTEQAIEDYRFMFGLDGSVKLIAEVV